MNERHDTMRGDRTRGSSRAGTRFRKGVRALCLLLAVFLLAGGGVLSAASQKKGARRGGDAPAVRKERRAPAPAHPRVRDVAPAREKPRRVEEERTRPRPTERPEPRPKRDLPIIEGNGRGRPLRDAPRKAPAAEGVRGHAPSVRRPAREAEERVRGTLERFRRDWVRGDSRSLTDMLSRRSRIRISIESQGIHDSFGRGQARYVLNEYLDSTENRRLSFDRFRVSSADGASAYGVGKMKIRDRKTGKVRDHTVFVEMAREGEGWAVREIRITD
jgi:hypothetical protein